MAEDVHAAEVALERSGQPTVATDSRSIAFGTLVSRATGLIRVVAVGAVLGPTYLGNTYQALNSLPSLVFFGLLAGSLFAPLLVPPVVRALDSGDVRAAEQLVGGFLTVVLVVLTVVAVLATLCGPLVLAALSVGVGQEGVAEEQLRAGWPLLAMMMPQIVMYGIASTAGAAMNACGRFRLAAAAPAIENVGIIVTLGAVLALYGAGTSIDDVDLPQLLLLGLGTTASVALHASVQWWGAWRAGLTILPRRGWRSTEVREVFARAAPSMATAGLGAAAGFGALIVSNGVAGGVVAFQLAQNFYAVAIALGALPVGLALLPRLSRLVDQGAERLFGEEVARGLALAFFLTIPAAVAYIVLAFPLARAVTFGEMATPESVRLVAVSLGILAVGIFGETGFAVLTQGAYARREPRLALKAMLVRVAIGAPGMLLALSMDGIAVLVTLAAAVSAADLGGAVYLWRRLLSERAVGTQHLLSAIVRTSLASAVMVVPAYLVAASVHTVVTGQLGETIGMAAAAVVGGLVYFFVQRTVKAPELQAFVEGLPFRRRIVRGG